MVDSLNFGDEIDWDCDVAATKFLPADIVKGMFAVRAVADGNCFCRHVSLGRSFFAFHLKYALTMCYALDIPDSLRTLNIGD